MSNLLLVRHGQIRANKLGEWHGSTDSPLNRRGRRQVRRTACHVRDRFAPLDAIYSSPLRRCRDTAAALGAATGVTVQIHDGLREYALGEWERLTYRHLHDEHRFWERSAADQDFAPPGGESLRQVAERIVAALGEIDSRHNPESRVLVVGHGAALGVALGVLLEQDATRWTEYQHGNCGLTELVLSPAPYVNFFNRTEHL
jgi:broad specificity phosphatase PhoE